MNGPLPRWADLEDRVEQFLVSAGYRCRRNVVLSGRSGATHEVDVLAERGDEVAHFRVAVECKAQSRPVEKEAVAKLAFVVGDIAADRGILVSLSGGRSGAARCAADLGITMWGPEEIEDRLGPTGVRALASRVAGSLRLAAPPRCAGDQARRLVAAQARGRLGVRRERVEWVRLARVAHHVVTVSTTGEGRLLLGRAARRSTLRSNLYDGVSGAWWRTIDRPRGSVEIEARADTDSGDSGIRIPPALPAGRVTAAIRRATERRDGATTAAAYERWTLTLEELGVPGGAASVAIEDTDTVYWPFWLGLLTRTGGTEARLVAVDASLRAGAVSLSAGESFTAGMGHILRSL